MNPKICDSGRGASKFYNVSWKDVIKIAFSHLTTEKIHLGRMIGEKLVPKTKMGGGDAFV